LLRTSYDTCGSGNDWKKKLIGFGCDSGSVNIANRGLKGLLYWVQFVWYLAHRLRLALKDALNNTLFTTVDEMLMRVYYIYEKSPKNAITSRALLWS
jgi:hypothetical protein